MTSADGSTASMRSGWYGIGTSSTQRRSTGASSYQNASRATIAAIFGPESRRHGVLVHDQAATRLPDGRQDGLAVPRRDGAQVDQLDRSLDLARRRRRSGAPWRPRSRPSGQFPRERRAPSRTG